MKADILSRIIPVKKALIRYNLTLLFSFISILNNGFEECLSDKNKLKEANIIKAKKPVFLIVNIDVTDIELNNRTIEDSSIARENMLIKLNFSIFFFFSCLKNINTISSEKTANGSLK